MFQWILNKDGKYLYVKHNPTIRAIILNDEFAVYGGGSSDPEPELPKPATPAEMFSEYGAYQRGAFPETYGAREQAAGYLSGLPDYATKIGVDMPAYETFGPTSFEEALATKEFEQAWPRAKETTLGQLSQSGFAYSPYAAATLGKVRGGMETDIGKYLSELGRTRYTEELEKRMMEAQWSEQARQFNVSQALGIQPMEYLPTWQQQEQYGYQADLAEYQEQLNKAKGPSWGTIGSVAGMALATAAAPFTGGLSLASIPMIAGAGAIGGMAGELFGGGEAPMDLGTALRAGEYVESREQNKMWEEWMKKQMGKPEASPVGDIGNVDFTQDVGFVY
jgi:hypothetical protein